MDRVIPAIGLCLVLAGCSTPPPRPVTIVQPCPAVAPVLECPAWPTANDVPTSLTTLQAAYLRGRAAHADCVSVIEVWRTAWRECSRTE